MGMRRHLGGMLVAGGLWAACAGVASPAQSVPPNPAPCTVAPQPVPCSATPAPAKQDNANKFPFPGENGSTGDASTPPASTTPPNSDSAVPQAPGAAADPAKKSSGADFPFPGEPGSSGSGSSSSGSGSSSSSSSSGDDTAPADPDASGLQDKGSEGSQTPQGRRLLHRVNPIGTKLQSPEEREAEDLDVLHFYTQTGDLKGAYLRGQDAVKTAPDDPDAHFALAGAALKLSKRDEAIAEFNACLKLDPDEKEARAARKELARLKP
jgi:Tetratricopeptide repeat